MLAERISHCLRRKAIKKLSETGTNRDITSYTLLVHLYLPLSGLIKMKYLAHFIVSHIYVTVDISNSCSSNKFSCYVNTKGMSIQCLSHFTGFQLCEAYTFVSSCWHHKYFVHVFQQPCVCGLYSDGLCMNFLLTALHSFGWPLTNRFP
jgi:hypothetical protein